SSARKNFSAALGSAVMLMNPARAAGAAATKNKARRSISFFISHRPLLKKGRHFAGDTLGVSRWASHEGCNPFPPTIGRSNLSYVRVSTQVSESNDNWGKYAGSVNGTVATGQVGRAAPSSGRVQQRSPGAALGCTGALVPPMVLPLSSGTPGRDPYPA